MKKKKISAKKSTGGHLKNMGHGTDDMTMIIIASGAFIVMIAVVVLTGTMYSSYGHRAVTQVSASGNSK